MVSDGSRIKDALELLARKLSKEIFLEYMQEADKKIVLEYMQETDKKLFLKYM